MLITNEINFMRRQRRQLARLQALDQQILYVAIAVFVIAALTTAAAGGYWYWTRQQLALLEDRITQQERVIQGSAAEEAEYILYTTRLGSIASILEDRNPKKEALDFLSELLVPSIAFDAVNYDTQERRLTFRVEAQDVFSVEIFLDKLREPEMNEKIANIQLSGIQRDEVGRYVMNVTIVLKESEE
ncbi:hypothetical protein LRY65_00115 [Candidatus Woesebacteria bacterium]|nr:hypothetical protein [Candidatus Woesebacteria bacterium]MCD8507254.1 hypothetical protein [Candidatus Woesebacteria bacterium]MCD8526610.1 hypothetical protein [Candidatus Woesebacteria bacterium]MCD8546006.1 hypothetical protein [Candidatus Woesebacteria bacterium]